MIVCSRCREPAIVYHTLESSEPLCLTHGSAHRCPECEHMATHCPLAGCGDWQPITPEHEALLLLDFSFIITRFTLRH